jgi:hypothetical protein
VQIQNSIGLTEVNSFGNVDMHILDQEAPGLSDRFRALSLEQRRRILAEASRLASESISDLEPAVQDLLKAAASGNALFRTQVAEAQSRAEAADERYSDLRERGRSGQEWLNWFYKARLLTALAAGFGGESWSDTADAVYELSKSRSDPSAIFAFVASEIDAIQKTTPRSCFGR